MSNNKHVRLAVIGCGQRGRVYSRRCQENTSLGRVVAVADPVAERRQRLARDWGLGTNLQFTSHADLFEAIDRADVAVDAVIIGTLDSLHREIVLEAAKRKLHILCEKPMATSIEDCIQIYRAVKDANIVWAVAHVLRYSPYNVQLKLLIESGTIGRVISVQHLEPIGWDHFAHSYVRGNWRREDETSFMLMTKSCHDIDILNYLFGGTKLKRVSSFGNLVHFRRDQKPEEAGSATRCLDCNFESSCPYSAKRQYLQRIENDPTNVGWPVSVLCDIVDIENVGKSLREGPYGRCVYECDNDVCDNQVVTLEFQDGRTATFHVVAFSWDLCVRKTRVFGTRGEITGDGNELQVSNFANLEQTVYKPFVDGVVQPRASKGPNGDVESSTDRSVAAEGSGFNVASGHGGGDAGVLVAFLRTIQEGVDHLQCSIDECFESHIWVFAAEEARKKSAVVDLNDFKRKHGLT